MQYKGDGKNQSNRYEQQLKSISIGNDLPATNSSDALPVLTFLEANQPIKMKMAYMIAVTQTPVQSILPIYLPFKEYGI
jgi:hypothetical protein